MQEPSFLLIQIRDPDDEIRHHELKCFARAAGVSETAIRIHDLLRGVIGQETLADIDAIFIGGSGRYSAASDGDWLAQAMDSLRYVHASKVPTFASCWGHQAIARAMGGTVVHAPETAEVGTITMTLTKDALTDPVFRKLETPFAAQVGHEDTVTELPPNTTLLASSDRCRVHAYRFDDAPIYCTQFHPELERADLLKRLDAYPEYVESIAGLPLADFKERTVESLAANRLIADFLASLVTRT